MPVALHIAPDHGPVEDIQGGEERRGSVALVVVGHGAETPLLHGQARLGAVERLDLAFLIDGQHDGVGRWIDVKPNDIAQFADEVRIVRELELPIAVRLQTMARQMRRTALSLMLTAAAIIEAVQWVASTGGSVSVSATTRSATSGAQGRDARRPRFVTQKAIDAFFHEPLLPAPDAGLRFARPAHDLVRSDAVRAQKDDGRPPHMFLGGAAVLDHSFKTKAVGGADCEGDSGAHAPESQIRSILGIPKRTLPLGGDH